MDEDIKRTKIIKRHSNSPILTQLNKIDKTLEKLQKNQQIILDIWEEK